jgi:4-aminobutyrate--pyruvate transaminase
MSLAANSAAARDIASLVHPYTNLDKHRTTGPVIMGAGQGCYVEDDNGKRYLEGMAGLWSASLGFSEPRLAAAAARQFAILPFYHTFNHRSHEPAIDLAEKLLAMAPEGLARVLFANSGSEANDAAVKLVWYYHQALGQPQKRKIISRVRAYHGVTVASASLTGLPANHQDFNLPLPDVLHTDCPSLYLYGEPGEDESAFLDRIIGNLEAMIEREGADTIAAFFAEPVMGAGGVIVPPAGYFARVQEILRRNDILFVVDEVITGFGRTGNMFGSETFDLRPDILTVAKALSASFLPISATLINHKVHDVLIDQSRKIGVFAHGHTYAGHPVAAAVALETLKIYEERDIVGHVRAMAPHFQARLHALADHPLVGEARGMGLIGAIELVADKATHAPFPASAAIPLAVQSAVFERGVIVRTIRDAIAVCPPLIIETAEIDILFDALEGGLDAVLDQARADGLLAAA